VQNAYVQAAMKVFVRATSDCREVDVAAVIGIVRSRIGIILQSLHIEVQERASTFRHILAEFEILSMTWQVAAEEDLNANTTKTNSLFEDLLDMPIYTANSVKAVDDLGAASATRKKKVLATIINEPFYAVHSKAQRRVPVPDGLDITVPFSKKECDKLFDLGDIPENINIANLYVLLPPPTAEKIGGFNDYEDNKYGNRAFSSNSNAGDREDRDHMFNDSRRDRDSKDNYSGNQFSNATSSSSSRPDDSLFYLGGSKSNSSNNDPLARILAETFEEVPDGKKKKKSKKDKKGAKIEVDTRELLPAGAMSSDDEFPSKSKKGKSKTSGRSAVSPSVDLSSVDLSAPLRDDEVLTELKHRQVPEYILPKQEVSIGGYGDGEEKKKKKSKSKEKKSASNDVDSNDLLGLDWGSSPAVVTPSVVPVNDNDGKKKKKSSGKVWQPLYSYKNVDLYYSVQQTSNTNVSVHCRVCNGNSKSVGVKFSLGGSHTLRPVSSSALQIVSNLSSGDEEIGSADLLTHDHQPVMYNSSVSAMVHITLESENNSNSCGIKIPITIGFVPNKITQEEFASQISKSSSRWGSSNLRVNIGDTKPKTALKLIASFLRAHVIEEETGKATSMCAKASNGGGIFVLAKVNKDSNFITVDIKCLCNDKNESQKLSEITAQALNELVI
jgi:hypothetical protein